MRMDDVTDAPNILINNIWSQLIDYFPTPQAAERTMDHSTSNFSMAMETIIWFNLVPVAPFTKMD